LILIKAIEGQSMLKKSLLLLTLCLLLNFQPSYAAKSKPTQSEPQIEVFFSPNGGCTEAIVKELGQAKSTLLVQAYSFTSAPIAKAVVDAHKRGVKVNVILDKSQRTEQYSSADFIAHAGIKVQIDDKHKIAHNKIMIIDSNTVITGSFNFTKAAEEGNAENLLIIQSADLAAKYIENWNAHAAHSEPYLGK
jgi:phosphatidylserine/phosphatidylglycerophosphate/cardiolipin synthase-like enzyme